MHELPRCDIEARDLLSLGETQKRGHMKTFILIAMLTFVGCAKTKAPGTNPSDMTAEQHRTACENHKKEAAAHDERAKQLAGGKGTYTQQTAAAEHADIARQHGEAATAVDPRLDECQ